MPIRNANHTLLALDDVFDFGLSALLDTFGTANLLAGEEIFAVTLVGVRSSVRTHRGLIVPAVAADPRIRPDIAILPALARPDVTDAEALLVGWSGEGTLVGHSSRICGSSARSTC